MRTSSLSCPHIIEAGMMKFSVWLSVPRSVAYGGSTRAVTVPGGWGDSVPIVDQRKPKIRRRTVIAPLTPAMSPVSQPLRT
jgi:hypothetical protein